MDPVVEVVILIVVAFLAALLLAPVFGVRIGWTRWLIFRYGWLGQSLLFRQTSLTRAVVNHLAAITDLNLPLGRALTTAALGERGRLGLMLGRLGTHVTQGSPLSVAMRRADRTCSPLVTSMIAVGEQAGQLPRALADLERTLDDQLRADAPRMGGSPRYWPYPVMLMLATVFVLALVMVTVMPKFSEIFLDFDTELPATTQNLIAVCQWLCGSSGVLLMLALVVGVLLVGASLALAVRPWNQTMTETILDTCGWIPGLPRPIVFGKGMSVTVRVVRMGLAAGMTLPVAAGLASTVGVNRYLRRRWERFTRLTAGGVPASQAAGEAGLGNVFAWACRNLETGSADAQLVLEHAADYHRAMAARWWRGLARMAWPAVTCLMGCMVGYVVLALFTPLVTLIQSVSEQVL